MNRSLLPRSHLPELMSERTTKYIGGPCPVPTHPASIDHPGNITRQDVFEIHLSVVVTIDHQIEFSGS